ncbi:hypothetical protein GGQ68_003563 [Sagittula marina]|uniref:Uncharacterized protein n=1 Tax=Sagittula marina TaxID=943940 RepID=A0A7W6DQS0_9RHOB|nr:hypothetical protein [Sagittula marina]
MRERPSLASRADSHPHLYQEANSKGLLRRIPQMAEKLPRLQHHSGLANHLANALRLQLESVRRIGRYDVLILRPLLSTVPEDKVDCLFIASGCMAYGWRCIPCAVFVGIVKLLLRTLDRVRRNCWLRPVTVGPEAAWGGSPCAVFPPFRSVPGLELDRIWNCSPSDAVGTGAPARKLSQRFSQ